MSLIKICSISLVLVFLTYFNPGNTAADGTWFVGIYGAQSTEDTLKDIPIFNADYVDSRLLTFFLGKRFWTYKDYLGLEAEGQAVHHWGEQDHSEFNALLSLRWFKFPWDHRVDTSFAVGDGISYATEYPEIEVEKMDDPSKTLNYLMFEFDFKMPDFPNWSAIFRIHHRSGVFGLFNGVVGGSNAVGIGIKYSF